MWYDSNSCLWNQVQSRITTFSAFTSDECELLYIEFPHLRKSERSCCLAFYSSDSQRGKCFLFCPPLLVFWVESPHLAELDPPVRKLTPGLRPVENIDRSTIILFWRCVFYSKRNCELKCLTEARTTRHLLHRINHQLTPLQRCSLRLATEMHTPWCHSPAVSQSCADLCCHDAGYLLPTCARPVRARNNASVVSAFVPLRTRCESDAQYNGLASVWIVYEVRVKRKK